MKPKHTCCDDQTIWNRQEIVNRICDHKCDQGADNTCLVIFFFKRFSSVKKANKRTGNKGQIFTSIFGKPTIPITTTARAARINASPSNFSSYTSFWLFGSISSFDDSMIAELLRRQGLLTKRSKMGAYAVKKTRPNEYVMNIIRRLAPSKSVSSMPIAGIEPVTYALRVRCSTNWAKSAITFLV